MSHRHVPLDSTLQVFLEAVGIEPWALSMLRNLYHSPIPQPSDTISVLNKITEGNDYNAVEHK